MKKLFGAKKKEEPKPPAPSLGETSGKVKTHNKVTCVLAWRKRKGNSSKD